MATRLTMRGPDGESRSAAFEKDRWVDPDDATIDAELDTTELWCLPGLADCHAHLAASSIDELRSATDEEIDRRVMENAWAQLAAGVFLVLDKGSKNSRTLRLLREPPSQRPHLEAAGTIATVAGGYYPQFGHEVDVGDLAEGLRSLMGGGATWLKLIGDWPRKGEGVVTNFTTEQLAQAVRIAHEGGCRVAIHAAGPESSSKAVAAGVDSIEHGLYLTSDDLELLGQRGGAWVPTIRAMEATRDLLGAESSGGRMFQGGLDNVRQLVGGAPAAGVTVLAGTDLALPHGAVAHEAMALEAYGLDRQSALDAVSVAAYRYTDDAPRLEVGQPANLVGYERNPLDDLSVLLRPALVLYQGAVLSS